MRTHCQPLVYAGSGCADSRVAKEEIMEDILYEPIELSETELREIAGGRGGDEFISVDDVDVNVNVSHNNIDIL